MDIFAGICLFSASAALRCLMVISSQDSDSVDDIDDGDEEEEEEEEVTAGGVGVQESLYARGTAPVGGK